QGCTFPTATAQWEKRNLAQQIPVWDTELCIQHALAALDAQFRIPNGNLLRKVAQQIPKREFVAQPCATNSRLGYGTVHPVRQVRAGCTVPYPKREFVAQGCAFPIVRWRSGKCNL